MHWNMCGWRISNPVRECNSIQRAAQLQVPKEDVMGKHEHALSLPMSQGKNIQRDVKVRRFCRSVPINGHRATDRRLADQGTLIDFRGLMYSKLVLSPVSGLPTIRTSGSRHHRVAVIFLVM